MALRTTTDPAEVDRVLAATVTADPVRNTVLGSVRAYAGERWAAWDGAAVAARSAPHMPVALSTGWARVDALGAELADLECLVGLGGPPEPMAALVDGLGRGVGTRFDERLYRLDELTEPADVAGRGAGATEAEVPLLAGWYDDFLVEAFGSVPPGHDSRTVVATALRATPPIVWRDATGTPAAMAAYRDSGAGVHRLGPVYTPPANRGHGYGSAVTAAATARVLTEGAIPVLYTDLANPTANAIYRRLGYYPVADHTSVTFS